MLHFGINQDKFNALPKTYQSIVRTAAAYANQDMQAKYDSVNPTALKRLVQAGVAACSNRGDRHARA